MNILRDNPPAGGRQTIGKVISVGGAQVTVGLAASLGLSDNARATVGKFLGIQSGNNTIVGMITEIAENEGVNPTYRSTARIDLMGELRAGLGGLPQFERGVTEYPVIGELASLMTDRDLRSIYTGHQAGQSQIGHLQQDLTIGAHINIDNLIGKHFAILGTTGVGKSNGVAIILQQILQERPNLRIFLIDPHNEYARCFGDKAQVLTPRNLRLPFWLFNFEETVDAFFGGRPGVDEEVEILAEVIPLAKAAYGQYRNANASALTKKKETKSAGFSPDTPVPYRIEDLITLIDERMGKLENRNSRMVYHKLIQRIQTFRNHPRYGFMFENATVGGDTMAEVVSNLFRLPPATNGKPMTIMQLAGFPAEVVDSVVSVVSRMAFDFGLWSDGAMPMLFVCEEAHRYAPADKTIGFGPTRRALSRIAKEGRKYGVFLGLVTQRPAEIDPNIITNSVEHCEMMFVMRLSNDRDQALIRSAVSDAAANLLSFIPSLGTAEVFAFGAGVSLPTRLRFTEMPVHLRPSSEAGASTQTVGGGDRDLVSTVIERWRSATMSHRNSYEEDGDWGGAPMRDDPPPPPTQPAYQPAYPASNQAPAPYQSYQPAPPLAPAQQAAYEPPQRPSLLRKPLSAEPTPAPPSRWR